MRQAFPQSVLLDHLRYCLGSCRSKGHYRVVSRSRRPGSRRPGRCQDPKDRHRSTGGTGYLDIGNDDEVAILESRACELFFAGHSAHWIQLRKSAGEPHRTGRLMAVEHHLLTIDYGGEIRYYRNHEPDHLIESIGIGGMVHVCEKYSLLHADDGHYFSIADPSRVWRICDFTPFTATTFDELALRMESHGGFSIPGEVMSQWLDGDEADPCS
jgi:hypothetical protein